MRLYCGLGSDALSERRRPRLNGDDERGEEEGSIPAIEAGGGAGVDVDEEIDSSDVANEVDEDDAEEDELDRRSP